MLPSDTPDKVLKNSCDVSDLLIDSINQLRRGQLDPRVANGVGYLASVLLRSMEQGTLEQRVLNMERMLGLTRTAPAQEPETLAHPVEAWDKDPFVDDLVGSTVTNQEGEFRVEFEQSAYKDWLFDAQPDLFFRVYRGDTLVATTERGVMMAVEPGDIGSVIVDVDRPVPRRGLASSTIEAPVIAELLVAFPNAPHLPVADSENLRCLPPN